MVSSHNLALTLCLHGALLFDFLLFSQQGVPLVGTRIRNKRDRDNVRLDSPDAADS